MERVPHENAATVLVDPRVLRDLEVHLMAQDLRLWPVATAPICSDGRQGPCFSYVSPEALSAHVPPTKFANAGRAGASRTSDMGFTPCGFADETGCRDDGVPQ